MDVAGGLVEVAGEKLPDLVLEHIERLFPVEADDDVVQAVGHHVAAADGDAALAQTRRDLDAGREQNTGQAALGDLAGDLGQGAPRRAETPDQEIRRGEAQAFDQIGGEFVGRVAVDDGEGRRRLLRPRPHGGRDPLIGIGDGGKDAKAVLRQVADHGGCRRAVEIFDPGRADADADAADPVLDAGGLAQVGEDGAQLVGHHVGDVDEPQPVAAAVAGTGLQTVGKAFGEPGPVVGFGMGKGERRHCLGRSSK